MSTATLSPSISSVASSRSLPATLLIRWHLYSLDAPSVAAAWLLLFNRHAPWNESLIEALALALAVWCIYALDRLLDAASQRGELHLRHHFHRLHRRAFTVAAAIVVPAMLTLVGLLPPWVRIGWMALALPLGLYAAMVHLFPASRIPKEKCVGLFFAVTVSLPAWKSSPNPFELLVETAFFGVLCWLNCAAIALWEKSHAQKFSAAVLWHTLRLFFLASLLSMTVSHEFATGLAFALSGALLLLLHRWRHRLDLLLQRALADAALLTPLLVLPFLRLRW